MANIDPTAGALALAGVSAAVLVNTSIAPTVGATALAGVAATAAVNILIAPTAGAVTFSGVLSDPDAGDKFIVTTVGILGLVDVAPLVDVGHGFYPLAGGFNVIGVDPFADESGTQIALKHTINVSFSKSLAVNIPVIPRHSTLETTITVAGVKPGRIYLVQMQNVNTGMLMESVGIGTAPNTLQLRFANTTAANINPTAGKTLYVMGL